MPSAVRVLIGWHDAFTRVDDDDDVSYAIRRASFTHQNIPLTPVHTHARTYLLASFFTGFR
jgi:hypothetical protein